jgi:hypothetical protein
LAIFDWLERVVAENKENKKMTMDTEAYLLETSTAKVKNRSNVEVFSSYYSCHHQNQNKAKLFSSPQPKLEPQQKYGLFLSK